ncbi:hypothetical protein UFOVP1290_625 [uncultured Caudovirales phage]|uniref:Uncharacterized protein n=1 Tax=uncultured Caudovirales phage TaxID=2100421 RepID=A0A6J5RY03_9CAUD|nr:hypothetical protein UFOVP1290_625 [uncultured Caudovirales phage]
MLRLIQVGNALPATFICDPSAQFQPGQIAELTVIGNQVMATVSNGTAPIGIIDDIKTKAFTNVSWNEVVIVPAVGVMQGNQLVTPIDIKAELRKPNIIPSSFTSTVSVYLNPVNGVVTFLAGTPLNFDLMGTGTPNAIRTIVNYTYQVANIPGDDSTAGSGRMTVWFSRIFLQTDQYETNQQYPVRANLFVSENGFLTTRKPSAIHPAVAMVTAPPTPSHSMLEILWW